MNFVDAMVFGLLALADLAGLIYWRRLRARRIRVEKMTRSLRWALQGQGGLRVRGAC